MLSIACAIYLLIVKSMGKYIFNITQILAGTWVI